MEYLTATTVGGTTMRKKNVALTADNAVAEATQRNNVGQGPGTSPNNIGIMIGNGSK